ncbi:MAG: SPOR domain-containing protein [Acidobacteriota bacterium]|nr:SPOR domain-containing protein [Acidobacteriota bacterium]MDH3524356.1 SPOR domain-containing protein [Acidobacteriota bacterium]
MNDAREASWYEIALTHSQVVKIFVGLLLCLVGAFFSGIWIGRDAVDAVGPADVAPPPAAAAGTGGADGRELARLNFFDHGDAASATATAEPEDRPEPAAAPPPQGAVAVERPRTTLADDLAAVPQVATSEPDAPVAVTREPAAPAETAGELVVQVFSSNDATQARRVLGRLAQSGHPAYLSPVEVDGRTMYRVRIGPYVERAQAERVAENVRRTFKFDTWITQKAT